MRSVWYVVWLDTQISTVKCEIEANLLIRPSPTRTESERCSDEIKMQTIRTPTIWTLSTVAFHATVVYIFDVKKNRGLFLSSQEKVRFHYEITQCNQDSEKKIIMLL